MYLFSLIIERYNAADYTNTFDGTSSASPVVSATVALMLEINPNLGWRDVMTILLSTATKIDEAHFLWGKNAVGRWYSPLYRLRR